MIRRYELRSWWKPYGRPTGHLTIIRIGSWELPLLRMETK